MITNTVNCMRKTPAATVRDAKKVFSEMPSTDDALTPALFNASRISVGSGFAEVEVAIVKVDD